MKYPCSQCGACCTMLNKEFTTLTDFPYSTNNGVCEMYDIESSKCKVYKNRPEVCNIEKMYSRFKGEMSQKEYYNRNIIICNSMIEQKGLSDNYKIKLL